VTRSSVEKATPIHCSAGPLQPSVILGRSSWGSMLSSLSFRLYISFVSTLLDPIAFYLFSIE